MNRLPAILMIVLSLPAANACAQQTGADASSTFELPSGPLLRPAPAFSQWTVTLSYAEDQKEKSPDTPPAMANAIAESMAARPRTIITTKTGEIIHEVIVTAGGNKTEDWQVHGNYYIKYPGKNFWSPYESSDGTQAPNSTRIDMGLPPGGFRGLDWINKQAYAGRTKTDYGDCLIFVPGGRNALNGGDLGRQKLDSVPTIAYVDVETRLPVMVRKADETRVFKFTQPPPSSIQTLPTDLADEIKVNDQIRAKLNAAPQREY